MKRALTWLAFGVAGVVLLFLVTAGIGWTLPEEHVATSSAAIEAPVDSVWNVVRDFASYPTWWPELRAAEPVAGAQEQWRYTDRRGGTMPIVVESSDPPRRLITRIVDDGLPFGGTWTYELTSTASGTRVAITEDGRVYNPIFRTVGRFIIGHHATMDAYLIALALRFGHEVVPEHS